MWTRATWAIGAGCFIGVTGYLSGMPIEGGHPVEALAMAALYSLLAFVVLGWRAKRRGSPES
jgi:hypothetical protein